MPVYTNVPFGQSISFKHKNEKFDWTCKNYPTFFDQSKISSQLSEESEESKTTALIDSSSFDNLIAEKILEEETTTDEEEISFSQNNCVKYFEMKKAKILRPMLEDDEIPSIASNDFQDKKSVNNSNPCKPEIERENLLVPIIKEIIDEEGKTSDGNSDRTVYENMSDSENCETSSTESSSERDSNSNKLPLSHSGGFLDQSLQKNYRDSIISKVLSFGGPKQSTESLSTLDEESDGSEGDQDGSELMIREDLCPKLECEIEVEEFLDPIEELKGDDKSVSETDESDFELGGDTIVEKDLEDVTAEKGGTAVFECQMKGVEIVTW